MSCGGCTHRPAKFSRGVQAGRRCLRAAVLRVAAVLVRRVAHVKRGGLGFLIPFHSLRVASVRTPTRTFRFAREGRHSAAVGRGQLTSPFRCFCTIFFVYAR